MLGGSTSLRLSQREGKLRQVTTARPYFHSEITSSVMRRAGEQGGSGQRLGPSEGDGAVGGEYVQCSRYTLSQFW